MAELALAVTAGLLFIAGMAALEPLRLAWEQFQDWRFRRRWVRRQRRLWGWRRVRLPRVITPNEARVAFTDFTGGDGNA